MDTRTRRPERDAAGLGRRRFITMAGTGAALLPGVVAAQPAVTKDTLRPMVDAAELAITDEQLPKLAGLASWARGELRKLREVETGLIGPAPMFLPPTPTAKTADDHE